MERVAFLIEDTGERIGCLLNPESLVIRRQAGVRIRRSAGGIFTGADLTDDQLLYCGGGNTELTMNLLFDVSLAGSSIPTEDVRDLTGPIWRLAENSRLAGGYKNPPICRFVWGKSWNIPGLITSVAERLEYFTTEGLPRRSLIRLLLRRVTEPNEPNLSETGFQGSAVDQAQDFLGFGKRVESHEVLGGETPEQIGNVHFQDPRTGRALMSFNDIEDPLRIPAGKILDIPPLSELEHLL